MLKVVTVLLSFFVWASEAANITIPFAYPLFSQCDSAWANDIMGTKTICDVGCLMSSTAMGLAGVGINIDALSANTILSDPKTFNEWLRNNEGYSGNSLIETQVPLIDPSRIFWPEDGMHRTNDLTFEVVCSYIDKGRIVIGNVHDGQHFVLLDGYSAEDGDTFHARDPGFHTDTYSYKNDLVGYRIFDMIRK